MTTAPGTPPDLPVRSGAAARLYAVFGTLAALPFALALAAAMIDASALGWLLATGVVLALTFAWLRAWRLEVMAQGLLYRTLFGGTRTFAWSDIDHAAFDTRGRQRRSARFRIVPRAAPAFTLSLRAFPRPAARALFTALRQQGIRVEVPQHWQARFAARAAAESGGDSRKRAS